MQLKLLKWLGRMCIFFKIDHKNGYQHVPLHRESWKFFGVFWRGEYYVFTVLPFGWKNSPVVYHSLTEAIAIVYSLLRDSYVGMDRRYVWHDSAAIDIP